MTLPIAISVPHAGESIPAEVATYCQLTRKQIVKDGDEFAAEIYDFRSEVVEFITTDVARAVIDLNRARDDRRPDGVVKTHTIFNEPIYRQPLPEAVVNSLLENYYLPYHDRLSELDKSRLLFAVDCHTMAAEAPPIGPDPGTKRPEICLGNLNGRSLPEAWTTIIQSAFQNEFQTFEITTNRPFSGGYITQRHSLEMPWIQIEISRSQFLPNERLREGCLFALSSACEAIARQLRS